MDPLRRLGAVIRRALDPAQWPPPHRYNLLDRQILLELTLTVDRDGHTRCAMSTPDADTAIAVLADGLLLASQRLLAEAERLATERGLTITMQPDGTWLIGNGKPS